MDGRTNVHGEELSGRPFAVSDDLVQSVDQKYLKTTLHNFRTFV
jgi:hypothetical protein